MGDRCLKCGRETYESVYDRLGPGAALSDLLEPESCPASSEFESDVADCDDFAEQARRDREAFKRGYAEAVADAKRLAGDGCSCAPINWNKVEAREREVCGG